MKGVRGLLWAMGAGALSIGTVEAVDQAALRDKFNPVHASEEADARINAHIPFVLRSEKILKARYPSVSEVRKCAMEWVKANENGKALPIVPCYYGEDIMVGVKGQAIEASLALSTKLTVFADREFKSGLTQQGAQDALTAFKLVNMFRFSSGETMFSASMYIRQPLRLLNQRLPIIKEKTSGVFLASLCKELDSAKKFDGMLNALQRLRSVSVLRYGEDVTSEVDNGLFLTGSKPNSNVIVQRFSRFTRDQQALQGLFKTSVTEPADQGLQAQHFAQ